jgi:hypothetical protein
LTDRGYDEEAEFSYNKITEDDIELIKPGAVFYWAIGYNHSGTGQKRRFSDIRFRRLPVWNNKEIDIARSEASQRGLTRGTKSEVSRLRRSCRLPMETLRSFQHQLLRGTI